MNVYEILEKCLVEIEQGADVDTVLFRHPEFADELRPILETSIKAKDMAVPAPPADVVRRNRAKVLQRVAEMREAKVKPSSRVWFASLRRLAVTLAVVLMLFVGGTGLVRAASNTIPGDDLYPVKRTWEDVLVLFTFNLQEREQLEFEHENERLDELDELFAEGRSVNVDFAGYVTRQSESMWRVSGISVVTSSQTDLPDEPVAIGAAVRIVGVTQSDDTVLAERIELLPAGSKLPEVEDDEPEIEQENSNGSDQPGEDESSSGSENEAPQVEVTETPEAEVQPKQESFEGTLESIDSKNNIWTVGGKKLDVSTAEITGTPVIGAAVKGEGYLDPSGIFVVTKIEIADSGSGGSNVNDNSNDNSNDNDDDDSNDDNSNDD
jgi:hypothetical protein